MKSSTTHVLFEVHGGALEEDAHQFVWIPGERIGALHARHLVTLVLGEEDSAAPGSLWGRGVRRGGSYLFVLSVCMVVCLDVFFFSLRVDIYYLFLFVFLSLSVSVSLYLSLSTRLSIYPAIYPGFCLFRMSVTQLFFLFPIPLSFTIILLSTFSLIILSQKRKKEKKNERENSTFI